MGSKEIKTVTIDVTIDSSQNSGIHFREYFSYSGLKRLKERTIPLILCPEILSRTLPLTWLPVPRHTPVACPSKVLTTQRMRQAEDQRARLVSTWLLGWLCVVPLLELAPRSSEEPATGIGQPVIGDMRKW